MASGKAALVVAGLPHPFEGPWVPLRGKLWQVVCDIKSEINAAIEYIEEGGARTNVPFSSGLVFRAERGRFILYEAEPSLSRISVFLEEVRHVGK